MEELVFKNFFPPQSNQILLSKHYYVMQSHMSVTYLKIWLNHDMEIPCALHHTHKLILWLHHIPHKVLCDISADTHVDYLPKATVTWD